MIDKHSVIAMPVAKAIATSLQTTILVMIVTLVAAVLAVVVVEPLSKRTVMIGAAMADQSKHMFQH